MNAEFVFLLISTIFVLILGTIVILAKRLENQEKKGNHPGH
jgi:hypothetical protein